MSELFSFLRSMDLSRPPGEILSQLRDRTEARLKPAWIAFYHTDGESNSVGFEPHCTSTVFQELLPDGPSAVGVDGPLEGEPLEVVPEGEGYRIRKEPGSKVANLIATLAGTDRETVFSFLHQSGTESVYRATVAQGEKVYGNLFVGTRNSAVSPAESDIETLCILFGHLCYIFEVHGLEKTRAHAFHAIRFPSLICSGNDKIIEVNPAFLAFFGYRSEDRVSGARLDEFFILDSEEPQGSLERGRQIAHPVTVRPAQRTPESAGILQSIAGATTARGDTLRYLYFLPDRNGESGIGEPGEKGRRYPQLELPRELSLTAREIDVAVRIAAGESSKEIARRLDVSIRTVQFHRQSLRDKLGIVGGSLSLRHALLRYERPPL